MDYEIRRICALNGLFRGSQTLTREESSSSSTRLPLIGAALTYNASCDFPRIAILMSDHTDVLCQLLHGKNPAGGESAGDTMLEVNEEDGVRLSATASMASAESENGLKRKR